MYLKGLSQARESWKGAKGWRMCRRAPSTGLAKTPFETQA